MVTPTQGRRRPHACAWTQKALMLLRPWEYTWRQQVTPRPLNQFTLPSRPGGRQRGPTSRPKSSAQVLPGPELSPHMAPLSGAAQMARGGSPRPTVSSLSLPLFPHGIACEHQRISRVLTLSLPGCPCRGAGELARLTGDALRWPSPWRQQALDKCVLSRGRHRGSRLRAGSHSLKGETRSRAALGHPGLLLQELR